VKELQPIGTAVACLMVEDEDDTNSYTFELKGPFNASVSDYDVPLFYLDEDTLRTDVIFDLHESDTAYVLIELEDRYGFRMSRAFTIHIKRDQSGSTGFTRLSLENDLVFPNPAGEFINLRNPHLISSFEMFEVSSGRMVISQEKVEGRMEVSGLPEGAYLVVIRSEGEMHAQKLLISR
ncbi:MAG: T9SS type A sorting domain-containing protein, partial [Bacteroidales bacterium]